MKSILTLSLLFAGLAGFAQKINLALNLKQDSTYYLFNNANLTIIETINGQDQVISTLISARVAHKVIAIKDTIYQMEVQYLSLSMHMNVAGRKIDFDSADKDSLHIPSRIMSAMMNKPFLMTISKKGKVLEIKNIENLYGHLFDKIPQVTEAQKTQFRAQMQQSFGEKAFRNSFQDAFAMFPSIEVAPNDKWVANTSIESIITAQIKTTYTLQDITDNAVLINGEAVVNSDRDAGYKQFMGFNMRFTNISGTATTRLKLDKSTGWILEAQISKTIKNTVEVQDSNQTPGGFTFPMTVIGDMTISAKLN